MSNTTIVQPPKPAPKIMSTVEPENQPHFNDWIREIYETVKVNSINR